MRSRELSAEPLFVIGAVSQYSGAAVAALLFDHLSPAGVTWLRVLGAAVVIVVLRRSWRRRWKAPELALAASFGVSLAAMNLCFYLALDRLPLGNTVAIEFIGPVVVAAIGTRTLRSAAAVALAGCGVLVLAGVEGSGTFAGVGFALLAGGFWAGYILLGHRVAHGRDSHDALGVGMLAGAVAISPFGAGDVGAAAGQPLVLALGLLTGLLSNVIPYRIDQSVMRRVDPHRFALLQALLPATAVVVGLAALTEVPTAADAVGIGLVIAAIAASRPAPEARPAIGGHQEPGRDRDDR
ncbi:MAG: EamA family transporter [Acidimicrobiaceae bacterium]|nr:EamA family transporter [Acidimicrobiaceae bacterium]MCY4176247.1 EamA family transporter [Acidimicrobiaceae bacterium]MCY4280227.1 EamA family transporter [Acidimicrobiaceae bacterium]MCY4293591.1 EamA family transporter [Acidimicrobiaceae bacterium]